MPNVAQTISRHNSKVLKGDRQNQQQTGCNCDGGAANCPVQGVCKTKWVVYKASIRKTASGKTETYTYKYAFTFMLTVDNRNKVNSSFLLFVSLC